MYELPFGIGKKWATDGASKLILGGWQINGIFSSFQGRQYTLASATAHEHAGRHANPDQALEQSITETGTCAGGPDPGCTFFDTSAFAPVTEVRFGNVGRNTMRAPGVVNMDLSLFRTFKLTEKFGLQFRAEAFNLSNTPHFNAPDSDVSSWNRKITSTDNGESTSAGGRSREIRFGLRLSF